MFLYTCYLLFRYFSKYNRSRIYYYSNNPIKFKFGRGNK